MVSEGNERLMGGQEHWDERRKCDQNETEIRKNSTGQFGERGTEIRGDKNVGHQEETDQGGTRNRFPDPTNRRSRYRDIRDINYAFSGPGIDEAVNDVNEYMDELARAGTEDENHPFKLWPKNQKYRTGIANTSPQMQERLQRCEQDQIPHEYRTNIPRLEKRNESEDIYPLLHVDESKIELNQDVPLELWGNTRRSSIQNTSASVYAVMHPVSGKRSRARRKPPKVSRNHLKENRTAITEMSEMNHFYKKETEEEEKRLAATRSWDGSCCPRKTFPKRIHEPQNFVQKNRRAIAKLSQFAREVRQPLETANLLTNRGEIPKYLIERKRELSEEVEGRKHERALPAIPKTLKVMSETERLQTLEVLEQRHKHLIKILKSFPLVFDTLHQIRMRSDIEQELKEVESSHKYYSHPRIYLHDVPADRRGLPVLMRRSERRNSLGVGGNESVRRTRLTSKILD